MGKTFEVTLTTEWNERNQITYLHSELFHTIQYLLWLTILSLCTMQSIWCPYFQASWNSHKFSFTILSNLQLPFVSIFFFKRERLKIQRILESNVFFPAQKYNFVWGLFFFFQKVIFTTLFQRCPTLWKSTLKMTMLFRSCITLSKSMLK